MNYSTLGILLIVTFQPREVYIVLKTFKLYIVIWRTAVSVTMLQSCRAYNVPRGSRLFIRKKKKKKV